LKLGAACVTNHYDRTFVSQGPQIEIQPEQFRLVSFDGLLVESPSVQLDRAISAHRHYQLMVNKIYKELTILGLISLALVITVNSVEISTKGEGTLSKPPTLQTLSNCDFPLH